MHYVMSDEELNLWRFYVQPRPMVCAILIPLSGVPLCVSFNLKVPDGLERWRLEHAMPRLLGILEDHRTLTAVTEQV